MRQSFLTLLAACLCGSLALAQGAGAGSKDTIAEKLREDAGAGPGYMQKDFLGGFEEGLTEQFGEKRSGEMMQNMRQSGSTSADLQKLMNGQTSKSSLQDLLGAKRKEMPGAEKCLDEAVDEKDRKIFGGIMIIVIVVDFGMPSDSEFCKQACGAPSEMSKEQFEKLQKGSTSKKTLGECFGFGDKEDQKTMQAILQRMKESGLFDHPLAKSLGMDSKKSMDPSKFGKMGAGSPGAGEEFAEGMAGGLPFDKEMPPCPFAGKNLEDYFGKSKDAPEGGDTEKKDEGADSDK